MNTGIAAWWANYQLGLPAGLQIFRFSSFPPDGEKIVYVEFEGAENVPLFKSGPRKGKKNWSKCSGRHVFQVLTSEMDQVVATYEAVTRKCSECLGTGQAWVGWSKDTGSRYENCRRCMASGKAPEDTKTCAT